MCEIKNLKIIEENKKKIEKSCPDDGSDTIKGF